MNIEKENFLRTRLVPALQQLDPATPPRWGKMTVQQMVEHLTNEGVRIASGQRKLDRMVTPPEKLQAFRDFLMSDKRFRENTVSPILPPEPTPPVFKTVQAAIGALQEELIYFFEAFEKNPNLVTRNPIFGDLDFEQNLQLLYKHSLHHLKQFGVEHLHV